MAEFPESGSYVLGNVNDPTPSSVTEPNKVFSDILSYVNDPVPGSVTEPNKVFSDILSYVNDPAPGSVTEPNKVFSNILTYVYYLIPSLFAKLVKSLMNIGDEIAQCLADALYPFFYSFKALLYFAC